MDNVIFAIIEWGGMVAALIDEIKSSKGVKVHKECDAKKAQECQVKFITQR